jgi:HEAT repeat protein
LDGLADPVANELSLDNGPFVMALCRSFFPEDNGPGTSLMKRSTEKVIPFNVQGRVLSKARDYLNAMDQLIQDGGRAITLLIKALDVAENDLKLKIVLMLGTMADPQVVGPLYNLMTNSRQNDSLRHAAAVQLSLVGGMLPADETDALVDNLIADLMHDDPMMRANAAFALGWEGNQRAVPHLVEAMCDADIEVQQAAVSALSNIRDERLFSYLADRLLRGSKEQKRCILYHLGCFTSKQKEVVQICTHYLSNMDADLRYDALVVLDAVSERNKPLHLYLHCLKDTDVRIREQALVYLVALDSRYLKGTETCVRPLLKDPSPNIRQAAIRLLHRIYDGPAAL